MASIAFGKRRAGQAAARRPAAVPCCGLALFVCAAMAAGGLPLQTSVTKDGVTWTFERPVPVGQFVNGDYYVVGPVTVTGIDPAPQTSAPFKNGSVKNLPAPNGRSSFDSRLNDGENQSGWFDPQWRVYAPVRLQPGDALVSSISLSEAKYHKVPEVMRAEDMTASPVATVSILTVLRAAAAADAFRPSYADRHQTLYYAHDLDRKLLPSLAPPDASKTPSLSRFEAWFRRPWIDLNPFLFDAPAEYMPGYGMHIALADSYVGLLLALDFPPEWKVTLTNYFVQYGIDLFGSLEAGYRWPAFGGHRSGRKLPILFAGLLLHNNAMQDASSLYPDSFGEDMQTLYINQLPPVGMHTKAWQGAAVIYGGHYGVHSDGTPVSAGLYGPYEHLEPRDWPILDPPREQLGESYRRCCTSIAWVGEALSARLLGAEGIWNHPAFFDYVDRWMTEDDSEAIAKIKQTSGFDYGAAWDRQGQTRVWLDGQFPQNTLVDDMWKAYRHRASPSAPAITSAGRVTGLLRAAFSTRIIATQSPTSYGVTALPAGISVNARTGLISGSPVKTGRVLAEVWAENAQGRGVATLEITISQ